LSTTVVGQRGPDLDLTTIPRPAPSEPEPVQAPDGSGVIVGKTYTFSVPGVIAGMDRTPPFGVRLLRLEPNSCEWTESVTYDVELRNNTRTAVKVPWSIDPRDAGERSPDLFPVLVLTLQTVDGAGRLGGLETLYGDSFAPFTTRVLQPGESVVIRATTGCHVDSATDQVLSAARRGMNLRVSASVSLRRDPETLDSIIRSNALPLRVHMQPRLDDVPPGR
ncbi:MAG: hypothetical protein ACRD1T_22025, partial [Acidimicrobiia bacterium]